MCEPALNVTPSLLSRNPKEWMFLIVDLVPYCHISLPCIMGFDIKMNHQRIQTTHMHTSRCHHCNYCHCCNVNFMSIHNTTCYIHPLLSYMHANTTKLMNITCTLVAKKNDSVEFTVELGRKEYRRQTYLSFIQHKNHEIV